MRADDRMLHAEIAAFVREGESVLDVGCGMGPYLPAIADKIGATGRLDLLDAYKTYLDLAIDLPHGVPLRPMRENPRVHAHHGEAIEFLRDAVGVEGRWDRILAIDFIEHLKQVDALAVLAWVKQLARHGVAVFTPAGFHEQTVDRHGLGGDHWQTHRSGWTADTLGAQGLTVYVWRGFHQEAHPEAPDALWATWERGPI